MADLMSLLKEFKLNTDLSFNIRYAGNTTLMSTIFEKLQFATEQLQAACNNWGMKINLSNCKVITSSDKHIILENEELEIVREFYFLGSSVPFMLTGK